MMSDVQELKIVAEQFAAKYGKPYAQVKYRKYRFEWNKHRD